MKKIFLLFGIATFSAASAQEKDVFDVQQYLQKKLADTKKTDDKLKLVHPLLPPGGSASSPLYTSNKPELTYTLSNGDKVIILGQDNMPCVVPDMTAFRSMPNVSQERNEYLNSLSPSRIPGKIPNAALPLRIIASK